MPFVSRPLVLTMIAIVAAFFVPSPTYAQTAKPKIGVSVDEWKFGAVDQGEIREGKVIVSNSGSAKLLIKKVGVTCGCVSTSIGSEVLDVGQTTELKIKLDSNRVSGEISKEVFIESNDPERPSATIRVVGSIQPVWTVSTTALNFGPLDVDAVGTQSFKITVVPKRTVKIEKITTSTPLLVVDQKPFSSPDGSTGFDCTVRLGPGVPLGTFIGKVDVVTDFGALAMRSISVQATVLGEVAVNPDKLAFGIVKTGESKVQKFRVLERKSTKLAIEKVTCTDPTIATKLVEVEAGKIYDIEVTYTPGQSRNNFGRIYVFTNVESQRVVSIAFSGSAGH